MAVLQFTENEQKICDLLVEAHNLFVSLPQHHPNDIHDWVSSLHNMQRILHMQILYRNPIVPMNIEKNPVGFKK